MGVWISSKRDTVFNRVKALRRALKLFYFLPTKRGQYFVKLAFSLARLLFVNVPSGKPRFPRLASRLLTANAYKILRNTVLRYVFFRQTVYTKIIYGRVL